MRYHIWDGDKIITFQGFVLKTTRPPDYISSSHGLITAYTLTHRSCIGQVSAGGGLRGSTLVVQSGCVHHRVGWIHLAQQNFRNFRPNL